MSTSSSSGRRRSRTSTTVGARPGGTRSAASPARVAKLQRVRAAGIETLVDPTAVGLGRDIRRIQRVNEHVDLNIVVCTGVYAFMELPQFLRYRTLEAL